MKIWVKANSLLLTEYELLMLLLGPSAHGRAPTLVSPVVVWIKCLRIKNPLNISLVDPGPLSVFTQAVELACPQGVVRCRSYVQPLHVLEAVEPIIVLFRLPRFVDAF